MKAINADEVFRHSGRTQQLIGSDPFDVRQRCHHLQDRLLDEIEVPAADKDASKR